MSIAGAAKTVVDSAYALRFIRLIQKDFKEWKAFETGVIDEKGNVIKRPQTDEEKNSYTPFHGAVRALKRNLSRVPGATTWTTLTSSLAAIGSRFGLTESEIQLIESELQPLFEDMVAGDAEGNPTNIAAGTTTGAVVNAGPQTINKKRKSLAETYYAE